MSGRLRRAGARWRLLVHEPKGRSFSVAHDPRFGGLVDDSDHWVNITLPNTEFDELVVGNWIHLEQMDTHVWWMDVAGLRLTVRVDRDGRPVRLMAEMDDPRHGCEYVLDIDAPAGEPT